MAFICVKFFSEPSINRCALAQSVAVKANANNITFFISLCILNNQSAVRAAEPE